MKNGFPFTINMKVNTKSFVDSMKKSKSAIERMSEAMKEETKDYTIESLERMLDEDDVMDKISEESIAKMAQAIMDMPSRKKPKETRWVPRVTFRGAWNLFYVGFVWDIEEYTLHVSLIPMVVVSFDFRATVDVTE